MRPHGPTRSPAAKDSVTTMQADILNQLTPTALNNWLYFLGLLAFVAGVLTVAFVVCDWLAGRAVAKFWRAAHRYQVDRPKPVDLEERRRRVQLQAAIGKGAR